jgi:AmmeMemoRadiSam system protein A
MSSEMRSTMTTEDDRRSMLRLAWEAIEAHLTGGPPPESEMTGVLARCGGAFVTVRCEGALRGCIGHIGADEQLGLVIPRCAVNAASVDPRFPALRRSELPSIEIEISLLGLFEQVTSPQEIEVGRHGLVVELNNLRGLLLPQVATERGWDSEMFLGQTCRKAGLPLDAWRKGADIWRFEAEVFSAASLAEIAPASTS